MKSIDELLGEVAKKLDVPQSVNNKDLNLRFAKEIAYAAECAAEEMGLNIVISVCDKGANEILLHAMDNSLIASIKAAKDKAYTAAALKMPTHTALEKSRRGGDFDGLTNGGGILLLGGGFPLMKDGVLFGGVGISGGTRMQDMTLARLASDYFDKRMKL